MSGTYPKDAGAWPRSLLNLVKLHVDLVPDSPPAHKLAGCPSVSFLYWSGLQDRLSVDFSLLTQIGTLMGAGCDLDPIQIVALSQLCVLDVEGSTCELQVTQPILRGACSLGKVVNSSGLHAHLGPNQSLLSFEKGPPRLSGCHRVVNSLC